MDVHNSTYSGFTSLPRTVSMICRALSGATCPDCGNARWYAIVRNNKKVESLSVAVL